MARIVTQDGTTIINGVSQSYRPAPSRRPPPTSADPRERDPRDDRADRDHEAYLRLARAL